MELDVSVFGIDSRRGRWSWQDAGGYLIDTISSILNLDVDSVVCLFS